MTQTAATKLALERDHHVCQWHKHMLNQVRHIFHHRPPGYHPLMAGGHHVLGRSRLDIPEAIIALCAECHTRAENHTISRAETVALAYKITGVNLYAQYREFCKWDDAEWRAALRRIYPGGLNGSPKN